MKAFVRFLLVILVTSGFFPQNSEREMIVQVLSNQAEAWNNGDIEDYMQGYWKSDSMFFTSGGNIQRGWQATLEKYKKSYSDREKMGRLKFSDLQVNILSSHSAWVFGRWELVRKDDHPSGLFTLVMRRFPEGWKIVHDHTSAVK